MNCSFTLKQQWSISSNAMSVSIRVLDLALSVKFYCWTINHLGSACSHTHTHTHEGTSNPNSNHNTPSLGVPKRSYQLLNVIKGKICNTCFLWIPIGRITVFANFSLKSYYYIILKSLRRSGGGRA